MKKWLLTLICLLLFVGIVAGGGWWMYSSARGALNPAGADTVMAQYMAARNESRWQQDYVSLARPAVTEFEDSAVVAARLFETTSGEFRFRPLPGYSGSEKEVYIISRGGTDLFTAEAAWNGKSWEIGNLSVPGEFLTAESREYRVVVPAGTVVSLNGKPVAESFIANDFVPYEDMTELEKGFADVPHRVEYRIPGLCCEASVEAEAVLVRADGTEWEYMPADAAAYSFRVTAPAEADVFVNGVKLDSSLVTKETHMESSLDIPEEYKALLPAYRSYALTGLYTEPVIEAALRDGTALSAEEANGVLTYALPANTALADGHNAAICDFMTLFLRYGAGLNWESYPLQYVVADTPLAQYFHDASGSLIWMHGMKVDITSLQSSDYIPLGSDAFLCRGTAEFTTVSRYQTVSFRNEYDMLWVNTPAGWLCRDMAFRSQERN